MSTVSQWMRPGPPANYTKKSSGGAGQVDSVYFQWQELAECQASIPAGGDCDVWIAVWGFSGFNISAGYTVTATVITAKSLPVLLIDGAPQAGNVSAGRYAYFYALVNVPPGTTYSVAVRPTSGDADLYVRTDGLTNAAWPSSSYFQFSSTNGNGDDYVNIVPGTDGYNNSALLKVAVWGYSQAAFVVTFTTYSYVAQLADGVSTVGTLPRGGSAYYAFSNPVAGYDLSFALTALSNDPVSAKQSQEAGPLAVFGLPRVNRAFSAHPLLPLPQSLHPSRPRPQDIYVSPWPVNQPRFRPGPGGSAACRSATRYGSDTVDIYATVPGQPVDPCYCSGCSFIAAVYCAVASPTCRYAITASTVSPYSMISLAEGRPTSASVRQWGYRYAGFDARYFNGTQRNITLRVVSPGGPAAVKLFVTNAYVPGFSRTSALPSNTSNTIWRSLTAGPTAGVVSINYTDPAVASCSNGAGCFYTIAVQGLAGGLSVPFTLTASSTDMPQLLVPGVPSAPSQVIAGGNVHFAVDVDDISADLVVAVTTLSGRTAISLDPRRSTTGCSGTMPTVACDGTWANTGNTGRITRASLIRVTTAQPCAPPYANPTAPGYNCTGAYAPGRFFIGVYGTLASTFTVTVLEAASLATLEEDVPFTDSTSTLAPVTAVYQPTYDSSGPSVRFSLDASASDSQLGLYVTSCIEGILGPNACNSAARNPGPANAYQYVLADAGTSADLIVTKHSPAFCGALGPGQTCSYYLGLVPVGPPCNVPDCDGSFTLTAEQMAPGARTQLPFQSISGRVSENIGVVASGPGSVNYYEAFLPGTPTFLNITLEACGPAYPSLYLCDPSPANGASACDNSFTPSHASNTGALFTAAGAGRASASLVGLTATALYGAVVADGAVDGPMGQVPAIGAQYVLTISSGASTTYLYPPSNASVVATVTGAGGGTTLNVSWAAPLIGNVMAPGAGIPAAGVTYQVYAAPVSFAASAAAAAGGALPPVVVTTTACGLDFWSRVTSQPAVVVVGQTWAELADLQPNTAYQVNVAAVCSNACWATNGVVTSPESMPRTLTAAGSESGLGAPGYNTQRVAYALGSATTGAGGEPVVTGTPVGVIAGAVSVTVLALAGALFGYCRYRRGKAVDYSAQYDTLDVSAAMNTISTPTGTSTFVRSASNAGSAILSSLRNLLQVVPSAASAGGGYSRPAAGMAESDYGEMDDRVAGYM